MKRSIIKFNPGDRLWPHSHPIYISTVECVVLRKLHYFYRTFWGKNYDALHFFCVSYHLLREREFLFWLVTNLSLSKQASKTHYVLGFRKQLSWHESSIKFRICLWPKGKRKCRYHGQLNWVDSFNLILMPFNAYFFTWITTS